MKRFKKGKELFIFYNASSQKDLFKALDVVFTKYPEATEVIPNQMYAAGDITVHLFDQRSSQRFEFRLKEEKSLTTIQELEKLEYDYLTYILDLFEVQWRLDKKEVSSRTEDDVDLLYIKYKLKEGHALTTEDAASIAFLIDTLFLMWKTPELSAQRTLDENNLSALKGILLESVQESAVAKGTTRGSGKHPMKDVKALIDGTYDGDTKHLMDSLPNAMRDLVNRKIQKKGKKAVKSSKRNIKEKLGIK